MAAALLWRNLISAQWELGRLGSSPGQARQRLLQQEPPPLLLQQAGQQLQELGNLLGEEGGQRILDRGAVFKLLHNWGSLEHDVGALQGRLLTRLLDGMGACSKLVHAAQPECSCLFKELARLAITRCSTQP